MERSKVCRRGLLIGFVILISAVKAISQEQRITLNVRHDHFMGGCNGTLVLDERGVRYETNHQKDARTWNYEDIKEFKIERDRRLKLYTYEDRSNWLLGADKIFEYTWSDETISSQQVYEFLGSHTRRPIAASLIPAEAEPVSFDLAVKHLGILKGNQGRLQFSRDGVVFRASNDRGSRSWRYEDLEGVSSGGPYDLTLTTYEQQRFHYSSRRVYNFQLKEPLPRDRYDALWQFISEKKR
jgi:hypothetical protein